MATAWRRFFLCRRLQIAVCKCRGDITFSEAGIFVASLAQYGSGIAVDCELDCLAQLGSMVVKKSMKDYIDAE